MSKPITEAGFQMAKQRLKTMRAEFETLPEIIAEAREKGDLKENAEYHAAREKQGFLQAMISKLESDMASSEVIDPKTLNKELITFGKKVTLKDKSNDKILTYTILGELEADISKNEITIVTPVAKGLLGKKVGETVTIKVPAGDKIFEILEITF